MLGADSAERNKRVFLDETLPVDGFAPREKGSLSSRRRLGLNYGAMLMVKTGR